MDHQDFLAVLVLLTAFVSIIGCAVKNNKNKNYSRIESDKVAVDSERPPAPKGYTTVDVEACSESGPLLANLGRKCPNDTPVVLAVPQSSLEETDQ